MLECVTCRLIFSYEDKGAIVIPNHFFVIKNVDVLVVMNTKE